MTPLVTHISVAVASAMLATVFMSSLASPRAPSPAASAAVNGSSTKPERAPSTSAWARLPRTHAVEVTGTDSLPLTSIDQDRMLDALAEDQGPDMPDEEADAHLRDQWAERLASHEQARVDHRWAPNAQASFLRDLSAMAPSADAFRVLGADCRTSTCRADLEFDSYDAAISQHSALLVHPFEVNCTRTTLLPEPTDPAAPYVTTVLFECSNTRVDG